MPRGNRVYEAEVYLGCREQVSLYGEELVEIVRGDLRVACIHEEGSLTVALAGKLADLG